MFVPPQHLHFIGIGGIGMSGIAEILLQLGFTISGSDLKLSATTERLARLGARIYEGHDASHVAGARALVVSSAIPPDNPELVEARRLQIPVISRGEMLAELMRLKYGIAVAGSHGKTTTTAMLAFILERAGRDPTVVVGGRLQAFGGSNARIGRSALLVVEADESDRSFLRLAPILAVITNIDREHLDHYRSLEDILEAFAEFANRVPFYGAAVLCLDDENVQRILPQVRRRVLTYGTRAQADLEIRDIRTEPFATRFCLRRNGEDLGEFRLRVPGRHNVLNAAAAVAAATELGVEVSAARDALEGFAGVERRFQVRGQAAGVTVIDDYGHHPAEIQATLAAARQCRYERLLVLFQPHRYTRTMHLMEEFARCFYEADAVFLLDIYPASEAPIEGVHAAALAERMRAHGHRHVEYVGALERGVKAVLAHAQPGDAVLTLGAGNVWQAGEWLLEGLKRREVGGA
ncbi:MAG: UDP-N-acetylmuramate--L-alanine ligase [Bryobacteraceae bacterium]|nr:UDP-N-acetylmuramate--L-alanine ligase [Bryobacteraceae bacterium]